MSEVVRNIENPQIPTAQSREEKNDSKSKTDINDGQIEQECDINKHIITVPNTSKIIRKMNVSGRLSANVLEHRFSTFWGPCPLSYYCMRSRPPHYYEIQV